MTKQILQQESELEIACLGIFAFCNATKLLWEVNQLSELNFTRSSDMLVEKSNIKSYHTRFEFFWEDFACQLILLKNKGSEFSLLKNKIEIPYFLFFVDGEYDVALDQVSKKLKTLQNIKAIQALDSNFINKLVAYI